MNIRAQIFGGEAGNGAASLLRVKRPKGVDETLDSIVVPRSEARTSNDRGGNRHRLSKPSVRIAHEGAEHQAELVNLSDGGAMIETSVTPRLWDRIDLHLGEDDLIECAVRWLKGNRIGLEFAHETRIDCPADERTALLRAVIAANFPDCATILPEEPAPVEDEAEIDQDQRGERRHPLIWSGSIYYNHDTTPVRLRNISTTGALIECAAPLHVGGEPLLDLGGAGSVFATISWSVGDQAGLRFKERFDLGGLAKAKPVVARTRWTPPNYLDPALRSHSPWAKQWKRMSVDELRDELEGFIKR